MRNVIIDVKAKAGNGRVTMQSIIAKALRDHGFDAEVKNIEGDLELPLDEEKINALASKIDVIITETQLPRNA